MNYMKASFTSFEPGIWEIAVLALLREQAMHPYQMQRLLRLRHKDELLALKRGSLYHAIGRLVRAGFIAVHSTEREGKRPERTTYRITPAGKDALIQSLRKSVSTPRREPSDFMAALSFLIHLEPHEAIDLLFERTQRLDAEIEQLTAGLKAAPAHVLPIHLIESEYLLAMLKAELVWVEATRKQIQQGKLGWDLAAIFRDVRVERAAAARMSRKPVSIGKTGKGKTTTRR
jgi:DNA-binding PadR family transcriptional regulator